MRAAVVGLTLLGVAASAHAQSEELQTDERSADAKPKRAKHKKKARKKRRQRPHGWEPSVTAAIEVKVGALTGRGTIPDGGGFARAAVEVEPAVEREWLRLELPASVFDRETVATTLPERGGEVEARAALRQGPKLRGAIHAGVGATWRPGWPDLYQPTAGGAFAGTSRQSHWDREVGLELAGIPLRHQHARLRYDYENVDYDDDDDYDPIDAPTHLVPGDHEEHQVRATWKHHADRWKLGGELDLSWEHWFKAYARDAGTGLTHAGSGGPPPNPRQRTFTITPAVVGEVSRGDLDVTFGYGLAFSSDRFEGYYSYIEQRPELGVEAALPADTTLDVDVDVRWRSYGASSYAPDPPDRPALDFGDHRSDRTLDVDVELRRPIRARLDAIAGVDVTIRRTNFPDYVPGVYPAGRQYDVDWDYDEVVVWLGVGWSVGGDDDE